MKKNKKYWKKEAKGWKEVARIESEEANKWAAKAIRLEEELEIANEALGDFREENEQLHDQALYYKYLNAENNKKDQKSLNEVNSIATWWKNIPSKPFDNKCNCNCKK